jgi:hypothetical protein
MWHRKIVEWMWRKAETAALVAAVGWTWIWMSRLRPPMPVSRARRLRASRAINAYAALDDRDSGAAWDRARRRRLVD